MSLTVLPHLKQWFSGFGNGTDVGKTGGANVKNIDFNCCWTSSPAVTTLLLGINCGFGPDLSSIFRLSF